MRHHLSIPSTALAYSAFQIAEMGKLLNREVAAVAAEVSPTRLQVIAPPHFDVGHRRLAPSTPRSAATPASTPSAAGYAQMASRLPVPPLGGR